MTSALLHQTRSLCPSCARVIEADIVERGGSVHMEKTCPDHGDFDVYLWPDVDHYSWLQSFRSPDASPIVRSRADSVCPRGCGLCGAHMRHATLVEFEVTRRCDLRCPVCFVAAGEPHPDPSQATLASMFSAALDQTGPETSVQLTGGEPTVRNDLPGIVRAARACGFRAVEINTNGLRVAREPGYVESLRDSGISGVYLQFDGLTDGVYEALRGGPLLQDKLDAIDNCRRAGVQVVLAMTVVCGLNDDQLGDMLDFAFEHRDVIAGIAFQPAFASGRFDPDGVLPIGLGDVVLKLADQSDGLVAARDLWPLTTSHPLCTVGTLLLPRRRSFEPATRFIDAEEYISGYDPASPQGSVFADLFAKKGLDVADGLSVVVMNYMDATNIDLERLRECSMVVTMEDGRLVPFCSYQVTTAAGERLHGPWGRNGSASSEVARELALLASQERA